jgi:hypothetical protein
LYLLHFMHESRANGVYLTTVSLIFPLWNYLTGICDLDISKKDTLSNLLSETEGLGDWETPGRACTQEMQGKGENLYKTSKSAEPHQG